MQISKSSQNIRYADPVWYFLAEISLGEILSGDVRCNEVNAKFLFQIAQDLGIPTDCAEHIAMTVTLFANEALARFQQGGFENPGQLCIFCQKKIIDEAKSARVTPRSYHAEQPAERARTIQEAGTIMSGGWGYFIIERSTYIAGSSEISQPMVDLYLYREGE